MVDDRDTELEELLDEVRRIEAQAKRLVIKLLAKSYSSVFRNASIEFDEVREYVEGDDPRSVDPNVSARMGRPFIKKFVDERELTVLFLLDLSASMTGGFGALSARQMAARICGCLALSAIQNDDKVGLISFRRDVEKYVPPQKGRSHAMRVVRDCLVPPEGEPGSGLGQALELASQVLRNRSILFLVSDFLGAEWSDALSMCSRRHDVIAVRLLTPELAPPEAGLLRVRDPETGYQRVVDFGSRRVREAYAARIASWRERTENALRRARVDLMDVPVPREPDRDAVLRPILRFFRMRELRGARR